MSEIVSKQPVSGLPMAVDQISQLDCTWDTDGRMSLIEREESSRLSPEYPSLQSAFRRAEGSLFLD
ncbi:MAG: hypothetical protein ACREIJ_02290 [Nitrospiraceae bacterium]